MIETLHENEWLSLRVVREPERGVNGYVYSHESRCAGRIVAALPFRDTKNGREWLLKCEVTPCWSMNPVASAITGGYEGGDIEDDAVREMLEETGYSITRDELIDLGESYASKSADTVYSLFTVDLTGREQGEALGDGTRLESEAVTIWVPADRLRTVRDPQVSAMFVRACGVPGATRGCDRADLPEFGHMICGGCSQPAEVHPAWQRRAHRAAAARALRIGPGEASGG